MEISSFPKIDQFAAVFQVYGFSVEDTHLAQWSKMEPNGLIMAYLQLSKSKLTMLITTTGWIFSAKNN